MVDFVTRLLLNNSLFDNSIRQSTQQLQNFLRMGTNLAGTVTKFAGVLGVAVSASEIFTTAINSNRTTLIEWQSTIDGAKMSVNQFFTAVSSGDWSAFKNGIGEAIGLAKEYRRLMLLAALAGKIGKTKAERYEAEKNNYEWGITSDNTTLEEKNEYHRKYINAAKLEKSAREETNAFLMQSLMKGLQANDITAIKDARLFRDAYETYLNPASNEYANLEGYKALKESIEQRIKNAETVRTSEGATWALKLDAWKKYAQATSELEAINDNKYNDMIKFQNFMTEQNSEEVMELLDLVNENLDKLGTLEKDMDAADADLLKATEEAKKKGVTNKKATSIESKSLAYDLFLPSEETTLAELETARKNIIDIMNHSNQEDYIKLKVKLEAKEQEIADFKKGVGMKIQGLDVTKATPLAFDKSNVKTTYDYADSLNAVASAMGAISSMTNEGASAWLTWTANLMTSIATAIPAILALTTAKTAEAGANAVASATLTPVVGWLLAGAAAASVIAAMATMPKFASGGIVYGNSTIGDLNLARVNAGEMILNNRQQRNLFNLLNNGGSGSSSTTGLVEFKISGKQLVGVLNNYNKQVRRI